LAGTLAASLGNITAVRNQRHGLPVVQQNAFGMLSGGLLVTLFALFTGQKFVFECTVPYGLSLLYLALFGSVLAFGGYLTLLDASAPTGPVISPWRSRSWRWCCPRSSKASAGIRRP